VIGRLGVFGSLRLRSRNPDADEQSGRNRTRSFRHGLLSRLQAHRIRLWLSLVGKGLFRLQIEVDGLANAPAGGPLIVAAAPHRNWIDPFILLQVFPATPRLFFVAAADTAGARWWKRLVINIAGGMAPVTTKGGLNRGGLETSLAILREGNRLGIFPEGWNNNAAPFEVLPLKRGVAFLSQHSGCRVLPVALAGTTDLWRGATLRVAVAPPLDALPAGADRQTEQAFVDRLREILQEIQPPPPPEPADGRKPWRWLTRAL
jgi:1-acyl-sn-glycerol-3-phosphate acyltransferase